MHLPDFNGDYIDWQNFKEMFAAVIDNNTYILPVQKLDI